MRSIAFVSSLALLAGLAAPLVLADDPAPAPVPKAPAPNTDELQAQVLRWVADLSSDDFRTREAAYKNLAGAGAAARDALEAAAKTSDSLEVRWRAQQLLLKLGGKDERPLGAPGAPEPEAVGPLRERFESNPQEAFRQMVEKAFRDLRRRGLQPFDPGAFGRMPEVFAGFNNVLNAGDLTLVLPVFGEGEHRLIVRGKAGLADAPTYTGASLDEILTAHPELKDAAGLEDLKQQLAERKKHSDRLIQGFRLGGVPGGRMTFQVSRDGVEMRQDANGVVVKIQERDAEGRPVLGADGKPVTKEFRGATFDEIKTKNPEIAKQLDSLGRFELGFGAPRVFRGPQEQGLAPMPPAPPAPLPQPSAVRFGLKLAPMEPVLALHLGLEEGRGVIVTFVDVGSQAERIGLRRYDVIESIDGQPVLTFATAVDALRAKAKDGAVLVLGIVRTGQRLTLVR